MIKGFDENLVVECLRGEKSGFRYRVKEDFTYYADAGFVVVVAKGFKTDFASVPWFFRRFVPKTGVYNEAAVVHDYLCYMWKKMKYSISYRENADKIFLEAMIKLGANSIRRRLMYYGVAAYTKALKYKLLKLKANQY